MKKKCFKYLLVVFFAGLPLSNTFAQNPALEMGQVTVGNGQVSTHTVTLQKNSNNYNGNAFAAYNSPSPLTVNFRVTSQNGYTGSLYFGETGVPAYVRMDNIGSTSSDDFTSYDSPNGSGISLTSNYAIRAATDADVVGSHPGNARLKMGEITITFSRGTANPLIHFKGLGGHSVTTNSGFATEFTVKSVLNSMNSEVLSATTLTAPSQTYLLVNNSAKTINSSVSENSGDVATTLSARGSVRFTNADIKVVVLEVFQRRFRTSATMTWTGEDSFLLSASVGESDLAVTKTVNNLTPTVGNQVVFTINATNNGASNNTNVTVQDLLPSGFTYVSHTASNGNANYNAGTGAWSIASLPDGASATLNITATVLPSGNYTNTATIGTSSIISDPNLNNNTAQVVVTPFNPCAITASNPDSDGDGISDLCDLDDDNDGILDKDECIGFIANNVGGAWKGRTASSLAVSSSPSTLQNSFSGIANDDPYINYSVNINGGDQRFATSNATPSYTITFSTPVPANEIGLMINDVNVFSSPLAAFKIDVDFGAGFVNPNGIFIKTLAGRNSGVAYDTTTGIPNFQSTPNPANATGGEDIYLRGLGNTLVKAVRIKGSGVNDAPTVGDLVAYSFFALAKCDADGDGIPNDLDLDSDDDGCFDAIEGGENVTQVHLTNQGRIKTNAAGVANSNNIASVNANGVPQLVNSLGAADTGSATAGSVGQPLGSSQDASVAPCCTNPPNALPPTGFTKTGISTFAGFSGGTTGWPGNIPNGFIALESSNKGFVITRTTAASIPDPVEGMMIYDTSADCVRLYYNSSWHCIEQDCGIPTN